MGPGATRNTASAAGEAVLSSIQMATASPDTKLHIARFGTFERVERPARQGFDINTRSMRTIPARSQLTFRPSQNLRP